MKICKYNIKNAQSTAYLKIIIPFSIWEAQQKVHDRFDVKSENITFHKLRIKHFIARNFHL